MSLADKYGVDEDKIKKMIRDGIISCDVVKHVQVKDSVVKAINSGLPKPQAVANAAEEYRLSERMVYLIIKKF